MTVPAERPPAERPATGRPGPRPAPAEAMLRRLVEIPSPSGGEADLARHLLGELPGWGFTAHLDEVGNVVARRGDPGAPMIMLVGHLDTVPGTLPVRQEGSRLYGRGTVDAKGPLATMIAAAAAAPLDGVQVAVVGVVEEETFGKGATHLATTLRPDALVVGEPNGWDGIGIGYKGRVVIRYAVSRPPAHTAGAQEKAGEAALAFVGAVTAYCAAAEGERVFDRPVPTLVRMSATTEHAALTLAVRTPPDFDLPALERMLAVAADGATLTIVDRTPAVRLDPGNPVARALRAAVRGRGGRPRLKVKTGTADLNILQPAWQVPAAVYGPGDSALDHTDDEHLDLAEFATAIDVLRDAIGHLAAELRPAPAEAPDDPQQ